MPDRQAVNSSEVRAWPYPYRAGITISNDAEFMNLAFFETLMEYLNTDNLTAFGRGLNLEVTSSAFHFSANPYNFSFFDGIDPDFRASKCASRLAEYLKSGWIDTLHAFGDFDGFGGFQRQHAVACRDHLAELGVAIPVFTNHGGIENIQNVGRDAEYHRGDHAGHAAYHTDLWGDMGIRYVWTDSMVLHSLSTRHITIKQRIKGLFRAFSPVSRPSDLADHDSGVINTVELNDGLRVTGFHRFRGTGANAPNLSSVGCQLAQIPWNEFYQNGDGLVLYQHLGVLYRVNGRCTGATIEAVQGRPEVYLAPFRYLSRESADGRLWIAGCARFLQYLSMRESIIVNLREDGEVCLNTTESYKEPLEFLQGLTIYIDPGKFKRLLFEEEEIPVQYNGPDETGRYSVSVEVQKLPDIWS